MKGMRVALGALLWVFCSQVFAVEIERVCLSPAADMERAELYVLRTDYKPRACLVFCPGINGCGRSYVERRGLQDFARAHGLGLVGLSFASPGRF